MTNTSNRKTQSLVARLPFACFLLTLATTAFAQVAISDVGAYRCSNHTLNGSYGFLLDGTDLASGFPFRGVVMQTYDGKDGIRQVDHVVFNGTPPPVGWAPGTGTYAVNPDC